MFPPMELASASEIPAGTDWLYEPKWDGFRCIAFRDGDEIVLDSKSGKKLERYFPEVVANLKAVPAERFVIDGELAIPSGEGFSFDDLLQRIHPADSRVQRLARELPARYIVFDLLVDERGETIAGRPLAERRAALELFAARFFTTPEIVLSPATRSFDEARAWLVASDATRDGVVAKRLSLAYRGGDRTGGVKIKRIRTADCVVGGYRPNAGGDGVGSLLLGLYDADGELDYVGFTSGFPTAEKRELLARLRPLQAPSSFTRRIPGGPSRWKPDAETVWQPLRPELVLEVSFDQVSAGRMRHGARPLRWRPDKSPRACTADQLLSPGRGANEPS
jgi:ATP-dependent DNA ligase